MGLTVTFVSGPRRSGKSAVIQTLLDNLYKKDPPHYLRLAEMGGDKKQPPPTTKPPETTCGVHTARWLNYDKDLIFEVLPEALTRIHQQDRYGSVLIEADADPQLRCAYPYDRRLFVMPVPRSLQEVFRTIHQAAQALRDVLDDTAAFAQEIYGMMDTGLEDDGGHETRPAFTVSQLRGFLNSPLGDELATRIQFQPAYHGLVESDVVLINTGVGGGHPAVLDDCVGRLERLLARLRGPAARKSVLFCCDPLDPKDPQRKQLLKTIKRLLTENGD